ncbi:MAG TPA: PT domain-containing protein [Mycobacteriales bacterium]|nr:PT domain-containing protein [Mycobacteriales bacterium]
MSEDDVPDPEMPRLPFFRQGKPAVDADDELVELLIAGQALSVDLPPHQVALAGLLSAASGAPLEAELVGEQQALAAFRTAHGPRLATPARLRPRRSAMITSLSAMISSKLALAAAAGAVTLGGATAAAYANALPNALQNFAHDTIGAPAGSHSPSGVAPTTRPTPTATPVGPNASGPAAYGLCTAYLASTKSSNNGASASPAPAFQALISAAGGADKVAAYCAAATPGGQHPTGAPTTHPTGAPTAHPTGAPTTHPTSAPTAHPTGEPTSVPTGAPQQPASTSSSHPGR